MSHIRSSSIIIVAALVADGNLHRPVTLRALDGLRNLAGDIRNLKVRAAMSSFNHLLVLFLERDLEALLDDDLLPFLELRHRLQNGSAVAGENHGGALAQESPAGFVLVG